MNFFKDIYTFLKCLTLVDITFFVAIMTMLILLVTLIYFIKINKDDVLGEDDFFPLVKNDNEKVKEEVVEKLTETSSETVNSEYNDEEEALLDLDSLTKKLQEKENAEQITINNYEKDQEEKAIISYDELLQKQNKYAVNYEKEEVLDDLVVKKVDLNDLINKNVPDKIKEVRVISYEKEEAFLNALKELNKLLN